MTKDKEKEKDINIDLTKPVSEETVFDWLKPFLDIDEEELPFS